MPPGFTFSFSGEDIEDDDPGSKANAMEVDKGEAKTEQDLPELLPVKVHSLTDIVSVLYFILPVSWFSALSCIYEKLEGAKKKECSSRAVGRDGRATALELRTRPPSKTSVSLRQDAGPRREQVDQMSPKDNPSPPSTSAPTRPLTINRLHHYTPENSN